MLVRTYHTPDEALHLIASRPKPFWQTPSGERFLSILKFNHTWREHISEGSIDWESRPINLAEYDQYQARFDDRFTGAALANEYHAGLK